MTGLIIVNFLWLMAFLFNEVRQFHLAWKNRDNYWTKEITGNIVDIASYIFFFMGFIIHISFLSINDANDSNGMDSLVIYPHFDNDHLDQFCPFNLPKLLIIAQAYFSIISKVFFMKNLHNSTLFRFH